MIEWQETPSKSELGWWILGRAILVGVLLLCLSACSGGKLTRSKAEELLRSKIDLSKQGEKVEMNLSWEGFCFQRRGCKSASGKEDSPCGPDCMPPNIKKLQDLGLIAVAYDGKTSRISLTPKGQEFALDKPQEGMRSDGGGGFGWKWVSVMMVATSMEFGTITGIREDKDSKAAEVEFTLQRKLTPFGENLTQYIWLQGDRKFSAATLQGRAEFAKYDDGWRVTSWSAH